MHSKRFLARVTVVAGAGLALAMLVSPAALAAPPANDDFANAITMGPAAPDTENGTNVEATLQMNEDIAMDIAGADHTVWYQWTPATNQTQFLHTCTSNYDTVIGVYTGNAVDTLTPVAANDDGCAGRVGANELGSGLQLNATGGTTYRIAVGGFSTGDTGTFTLALTSALPPPIPPSVPVPMTPTATPTATPVRCKKGQKLKKGKCVKKKKKKK
jgi:hypothetical protein